MRAIRINTNGDIIFIHEDNHTCSSLGKLSIYRASNVEPTEDACWVADMKPLGGPKLPETELRSQSIELEREWIGRNIIHK